MYKVLYTPHRPAGCTMLAITIYAVTTDDVRCTIFHAIWISSYALLCNQM